MSRVSDWTRYTIGNAQQAIFERIYTKVEELDITAWRTSEPVGFAARTKGEKLSLKIGDSWGGLFDCAWFNFKGRIPRKLAGQPVVLLLDVNGEMCVVDSRGEPVRGLTSVTSEFDRSLGSPAKRVLPLVNVAKGGEAIDIWADAGCNDLFGYHREDGRVREAHIAVCNELFRSLYYDFEVLHGLAKELGTDNARGGQIYDALDRATKTLRDFTAEEAEVAQKILAPELAKRNGDVSLTISAVGHAHIDLGWLWPIRETIRKGARTFATALANMEVYEDYVFGASQAQLFQWMKEYYPSLYKRVKQRVADGRFEVQGGMWVESDTNLIGGESMVRQFLYGKKFFKEEFGVDVKHLWLPDVFGFSGALPQIMSKSGVDILMTMKLSWSRVNKFPHHSFAWKGIDGTTVLAHMLPEGTYNSAALPKSLLGSEKANLDKCVSNRSLTLFGIGDGGGGPGEEHLERLSRMKNLAGLPKCSQEPANRFFKAWRKDAHRFQEWVGELYLERHQGTLTTQAANKRYNRKIEIALRELEWAAAMAHTLKGAAYPGDRIESIWKEVLLYQFHDILPGSSIKRVYDESKARYAILMDEVERLTQDARKALVKGAGGRILFNSLSWPRSEWVKAGTHWANVEVPAMGYTAIAEPEPTASYQVYATRKCLENDCIRVEFAKDGTLSSVWDKAQQREVLSGAGNALDVYADDNDAWDFDMDYSKRKPVRMKLQSSEAKTDGPFAILEQCYAIGHSTLRQTIRVTAGSKLIEFATTATWREKNCMLRTSFPVEVFAENAHFEIQYGHISRATHTNNTWDMAKEEVAAHKWADLSQRDYGVALLNDCKYGHKVKGKTLDLALIRSLPHPGSVVFDESKLKPGEPNHKFGDQCEHEFRYALLPHQGDHVAGGVARAAYEFNIKPGELVLSNSGSATEPVSTLALSSSDIVVEAVKISEDGKALIIRLYETTRAKVRCRITFNFPVKSVEEANLLEESQGRLVVKNAAVDLEFTPFEIKTIVVKPLAMG